MGSGRATGATVTGSGIGAAAGRGARLGVAGVGAAGGVGAADTGAATGGGAVSGIAAGAGAGAGQARRVAVPTVDPPVPVVMRLPEPSARVRHCGAASVDAGAVSAALACPGVRISALSTARMPRAVPANLSDLVNKSKDPRV